jgi:hypothetical protein
MSINLNNQLNVIINGDMRISQRGSSFSSTSNTQSFYTLDRWFYAQSSAVRVTISQDTNIPSGTNFSNSLKIDITTADTSVAAGDYCYVCQYIEGYDFKPFVGKTAILSFWIKSGYTGTMCISFRSGGSDRSYVSEVTINSANTWEFKTVQLSFNYSGGTWDYTNGLGVMVLFQLLCGSTYQTTANAWQTGAYMSTANQTNFVGDVDKDFWLTGIQLTLGSQVPPFQNRDYQEELMLCQRYYYEIASEHLCGIVGTPVTNIDAVGGTHPVPMRDTPVPTFTGTINVWDGTVARAITAITNNYSNTLFLEFSATVVTGMTALGQAAIVYCGQSGKIMVSAEL